MAKAFSTVISIEPKDSIIRILSAQGTDTRNLEIDNRPYKAVGFGEDFDNILTSFLSDYSKQKPSFAGKAANVTFVLPNNLVLTDTVSIPVVGKKQMENLVRVSLEGRYKNFIDLKMNKFVALSNKQYMTYGVAAVSSKIVQSLYSDCVGSNMFANVVTYAGSAAVNAVLANNKKLQNESFVFADIKEGTTVLCYVANGLCLGSINLPFGAEVLRSSKVTAENMLFDHSVAELAVLNAKEKAKAKELTMMSGMSLSDDAEDDEESAFESAFANAEQNREAQAVTHKTLPKKTPRVLPKFMQRPEPETPEDLAYENFRVFEKYIFEFIRSNKKLTAISSPRMVLLNMPTEYEYLLERTNEGEKENGLLFEAADFNKEGDVVKQNLELYGGVLATSYNKQNNF